jgi:nucleolar protein 56
MYAKVVKIVKNRKELTEELFEQLEEAVMDSAKARAIIDASKSSMGKRKTFYLDNNHH